MSAKQKQTAGTAEVIEHPDAERERTWFEPPAEVGAMRLREKGHARGADCYYNLRQQFCVVSRDDVAGEPLKTSYIGEVLRGDFELALAGTQTWLEQGKLMELELV
jgi:hypothetical protein